MIYDINSLKYMMKLLKCKWGSQRSDSFHELDLDGIKMKTNHSAKMRSIHSSSPVLENNL